MRRRNLTTITAAIISLLIVSGSMIEGLGKFPKAINTASPAHSLNKTVNRGVSSALPLAAASLGKKATAKPTPDAFSHTKINKLMTKAQAAIDTPVIVDLNVPFTPEGELSDGQILAQRAAIAQARINLLNSLSTADYDPSSVKTYEYVPNLALTVNATALSQLQSSQYVTHVYDDVMTPAATETETLSLIGAAQEALALDYTGAGQTIVVLGTGVDKTHNDFAGKVVSEACYSTNRTIGTTIITSLCPNQALSSTAAGAGVNCTVTSDCNEGTQVAGIAASASGVAVGANLIAIQIYSRVNSVSVCGSANPCIRSQLSDQMAALNYVSSLKGSYNIAAVNLSVATGRNMAACDATNSLKNIIEQLRSLGIATITPSGNDSYHDALGSPACVSLAISVGATENGRAGTVDTIWPRSNSAEFLNLLAPGNLINAPIPGGGHADASGTSFAAAHVAGAWAILKEQQPGATVTDILNRLKNNGVNITDPRNQVTLPRIRIDAALSCLQNVPTNWRGEYYSTVNLDQDAGFPNPTMIRDDGVGPVLDKNLGDGTLTSSCGPGTNNISMRWTKVVNLPTTNLYAFTVTADQYARLYVDGVAQTPGWDNISGSKTYPPINLSSGSHTLKLEYKTTVGATGAKLRWSVPPAAPTNLTATASTTSLQISLSWIENDSNVSGYKIERSAAGGPYSQIGTSSITSYTDAAGLAYGATYTYRVAAFNSAGSNSATSNAVTTIPAAPTNLTATANSPSQITLNWTNNSSALGIRIERWNGSSWSQIATVGASVTTHPDTGLAPATAYFYRVRAFNSTGNSSYSNESSATTLCSYVIPPSDISWGWEGYVSDRAGLNITVSSAAGCSWSATSDSWIHITSGASGAGNGTVVYWIDDYMEPDNIRTGAITIAGHAFTITQYGPICPPITHWDPGQRCCAYNSGGDCGDDGNPHGLAALGVNSATDAGSRGLTAHYFSNTTLSGQPALQRTDPVVNFNWAGNRLAKTLPAKGFSARWNGQLAAPSSEAYTFYLYSDGGARLWVNNQLVIDRWLPSSEPYTRSAPVELKAGEKSDIRVEYYNTGEKASLHLLWSSASMPKQIVPQRHLYPEATTDKSAQSDTNKQTGMLLPPRSDAGPKAIWPQPSRWLAVTLRREGLALLIACGLLALLLRIGRKELKRTDEHGLCRKRGSLKGKTPAQAAGLTDHRWTLGELLTFGAATTSNIRIGSAAAVGEGESNSERHFVSRNLI